MSIATKALSYGWKIVAGAVLTGATIYTPTITRWYITQRDVVPIVLGTVERCLATQYLTNTFGTYYRVVPPEYIRRWVSTNGVGDWENETYTNTLSWYTDHALLTNLDAKIFALIRYYVDTNTVYTGSTNISMLTVTGLFASLQIGDHTNRFTAIPAIGTNPATYGPWAWRNYITAWQERYKVLNALQITRYSFPVVSTGRYVNLPLAPDYVNDWTGQGIASNWDEAKTHAVSDTNRIGLMSQYVFTCLTAGQKHGQSPLGNGQGYKAYVRSLRMTFQDVPRLCTNIPYTVYHYIKATAPDITYDSYTPNGYNYGGISQCSGGVFDDNGLGVVQDAWVLVTNSAFGLSDGVIPNWCEEPVDAAAWWLWYETWYNQSHGFACGGFVGGGGITRGFQIHGDDQEQLVNWQFLYCTNKYW